MAKLTPEKQAQLDALIAEQEAPEANGGGRMENVDVYIDLSDEAAVERAIRHGFLTRAEAEADPDPDPEADPDPDPDTGPKRKGYFG